MLRPVGCNGKELFSILSGATIIAFGVTWFAAPHGLVTGGVTGIAIVVRWLTSHALGYGVPLWVTNLVLNIPLFLVSIHQRGFSFAQKSLYAVVWLSAALWFTEMVPNIFTFGDDLLLASVFCGVLNGTGVGLALKVSATTGGTDMLASAIKYKWNHLSISRLIMMIDGVIIVSGFFIFGAGKAMYAVISVVISSQVTNSILEGMYFAKAAFILSEKSAQISTGIFATLMRGNTGISARGMYTGKETQMLLVVVSRKELSVLRRIVKDIDPAAFIIIADVKEVFGEGFSETYDALTL